MGPLAATFRPHTPAWGLALLLVGAGCGNEVTLSNNPPPGTSDGGDVRPDDTVPPIAICTATPATVDPFEPVDWVASESYDPDDVPLIDYRWTLIQQPERSTAMLPQGLADLEGFIPDAVGSYGATLVVTNDRGTQSDPCSATVEAVPSAALYVELTWELNGEDLDLHLVRDGGLPDSPDDCWVGSCSDGELDWGTPSDTTDDPYIAGDDVEGTGPESIAITAPDDDTYLIVIEDNPAESRRADNEALVVVYLDGVEAWRGTRVISKEGSLVPVVELDWATKSFTEVQAR